MTFFLSHLLSGSTTQPPCTEPVHWQLIDSVFDINVELFNALQSTLSNSLVGNARNIQRSLDSVYFWDAEANAVTDSTF